MRPLLLSAAALVAVTGLARAERLPQRRVDADLVVTGKVTKLATKTGKFGDDGEMTTYTARVEVTKVDSGKGAEAGDTVEVTWFRVTKSPSKPLPGAYGHSYPVKEKDEAKFWLMKHGKKSWAVIYNSNGVEKRKK